MLNEADIKDLERVLSICGEDTNEGLTSIIREHGRGYCQGIWRVLDKIGYDIEWDGNKAKIVTKGE